MTYHKYFSLLTLLFAIVFSCSQALHASTIVPIAKDMTNVVWLHTNVSSWQQTATLSSVTVDASKVTLNYNKSNTWPGVTINASHGGTISVNSNPWIFVYRNGTWYAATWEWMQVGQTVKGTYAVKGDHIKTPPLDTFYPVKGEVYGFMVSALARDSDTRNVSERSNVVMVTWPLETQAPCSAPPTISSFSVSDNPAQHNSPLFNWTINNANSATISPLIGAIAPTTQGSTTMTVTTATTFTLSAVNDCGTSTKTAYYSPSSISGPLHLLLAEPPRKK